MLRFFTTTCLFLGVAFTAFSQKNVDEQTGWSVKDRAYVGLGFGGLGLGTSSIYGKYFSIGATPLAGYMLTKNLSAGMGFEYQYTSYSDIKIKVHQYGWYPFLRYNISDLFIQVDYDWYSVPTSYTAADQERTIYNRFFSGLGYTSRGGGSTAFNILLSYDLIYSNVGPFNSPISLRAFMTF